MKVAQILCAGGFGGAEAVACSLTRALQTFVDRSVLYLVKETRGGPDSVGRLVERARGYDIDIRFFETHDRYSRDLFGELRDAYVEDEIDVVHNHNYKVASYSALICRFGRVSHPRASVFTVHGFDQQSVKGIAFLHSVNALGAYLNHQIIGVSQPLCDYYRRLPLLAGKTQTIPNSVIDPMSEDLGALRAGKKDARRALKDLYPVLDVEATWIGCVGRLVPVKNHALLFDVAKALPRDANVQFLVAGDGPLRAELHQRIESQSLSPRVVMLGQVEQIDRIYRAIDAHFLTSDSEGSPMVLLEAMSYGVPLVATRVGGVPDLLIDGDNGLLFSAGDRDGGRAAIERLLADPALRERLGTSGHQKASAEFHWTRWAKRHVALYEAALA